MSAIDKRRVMHAFGKNASQYDNYATVQKIAIARIIKMLEDEDVAPTRLLDVGAGTGMLMRELRGMFHNSVAVGIDFALGMSRTAKKNFKKTAKHIS